MATTMALHVYHPHQHTTHTLATAATAPRTRRQAASEEEREHAEKLMEYQNVRGGRVRLASMVQPETEFNHADKVRGGAAGTCRSSAAGE
jgi:ferritin